MTDTTSPFHRGERDIQARLGIEDKMREPGRRMIRNSMSEQHREFYAQLPVFFAGSADDDGRVWASALAGAPGFVQASNDRVLTVRTRIATGDPLARNLKDGADIGGLGLEFETRRRNRVNGRIANAGPDGFDIAVRQSFGNCPKYIQTRSHRFADAEDGAGGKVHRGTVLGAADAAMVAAADTFFIASRFAEDGDAPHSGIDVSHRGGATGFVLVSHEGQLLFPDYPGNRMYNTLGNLQADPRCGLLFIDFASGDTLQLTGQAEILWDAAHTARFPGAQRVIVVNIEACIRIESALSLRWDFGEASPVFALPAFERPATTPALPPMLLQTISVAQPKEVPGPRRSVSTSIFKQPVTERIMLRRLGLQGNGQADLRNHGGSFRAVYVYDAAHCDYWARELGRNDFAPGQFGENFTVTGMSEGDIHIGDVFRIGEALVEVTQPRIPCFKLTLKMGIEGFQETFLKSGRFGFYFRVLEEGMVGAGDDFIPVHRDPDSLSVARVNALLFFDKGDLDGARRAWNIAALSHGWKESFAARLKKAARTP